MKTKILVGVLFLVFAGLSLILPKPVFSQEKNPEALKAVQKLKERMGKIKTEWRGPNIVKLEGNLSLPHPGTPEEAATQFLKENAAIFQIPSDISDVAIETMREDKVGDKHLGYYVRFKQTYKGLPIFDGGGVGVSLKPDKSVSKVSSSYLPSIDISTTPTIAENEAIEIAKNDYIKNCHYSRSKYEKPQPCGEGMLKELVFKGKTKPQLSIFEHQGNPYLVYKIFLDVKYQESPLALMEYIIDANNGTMLEGGGRNLIKYFDGTGDVFDPNPVNTLNNIGLQDNNDRNSPLFKNAYFTKTLKLLAYDDFYYLVGPYADVTDNIEPPFYFSNKNGYIFSKQGDFSFRRNRSQFEHVMVYYHIDTNQYYIQSLGFANINNRRIKADPHGLDGADNSHYVPDGSGTGYLAFGEGGVDDAEDADIILHEYGHAIQDNQAPGKYDSGICNPRDSCNNCQFPEAAAMGEGFGDYWAASNTYDISTANGFDPACIGEWDAVPNCLRRVDGTKHYPEAIVNECHADGEIWSSALWGLFNSVGKTVTDTLILYSHFIINNDEKIKNPTFCDGAKAIIDADKQLYGGTNKNTIAAVMMNRGIGAQATKFVILDPADSIPGTPVTVTIQAQNCFDAVVTDYQNDVTLVTSGSATGGGLVDIVDGVGIIEINDTVAETVNLSLSDTQSTGLDISSTQDVIFQARTMTILYTKVEEWPSAYGGGAVPNVGVNRPATLTFYLYPLPATTTNTVYVPKGEYWLGQKERCYKYEIRIQHPDTVNGEQVDNAGQYVVLAAGEFDHVRPMYWVFYGLPPNQTPNAVDVDVYKMQHIAEGVLESEPWHPIGPQWWFLNVNDITNPACFNPDWRCIVHTTERLSIPANTFIITTINGRKYVGISVENIFVSGGNSYIKVTYEQVQ